MHLVQVLHKLGVVRERFPAVLAHEHLRAPFPEAVLVHDAVYARQVRLERAALRERFVAAVAFEWFDACVCSDVPFEVECVVEALATVLAVVALVERVRLHVSIQQSLERKRAAAYITLILVLVFPRLSLHIPALCALFCRRGETLERPEGEGWDEKRTTCQGLWAW